MTGKTYDRENFVGCKSQNKLNDIIIAYQLPIRALNTHKSFAQMYQRLNDNYLAIKC